MRLVGDGHPTVNIVCEGAVLRSVSIGVFSEFELEYHRGKWVVLSFHPLDLALVCSRESSLAPGQSVEGGGPAWRVKSGRMSCDNA